MTSSPRRASSRAVAKPTMPLPTTTNLVTEIAPLAHWCGSDPRNSFCCGLQQVFGGDSGVTLILASAASRKDGQASGGSGGREIRDDEHHARDRGVRCGGAGTDEGCQC